MFENLISKILRIERESIPNRQEVVIAPDVIYHPHLFLKNTGKTSKRSERKMEMLSKLVSVLILHSRGFINHAERKEASN